MARIGRKKKTSKYSEARRKLNKIRKITNHLKKHPNDLNSQSILKTTA